ncbi:2-phospho-L-lactate transferase CofD family protein [Alphaproteobacteria bacterium]|nr:2-phospho-L-lactate transferase CofD family protein [Alphaproteobacteria bacterium]
MIKILFFNGGRGASNIINSAIATNNFQISSIVNAYDDGKSTGEIRNFFNMLGPSDIRKVQENFIPQNIPDTLNITNLFKLRFPNDIENCLCVNEFIKFTNDLNSFLIPIKIIDKNLKSSLYEVINIFIENVDYYQNINKKLFNFSDCSFLNCLYVGAFFKFNRNLLKAINYISNLFFLNVNVLPNSLDNKILVGLREDGKMLYSESEIVELRSNVRLENIFLLDFVPKYEFFDKLTIEEKRHYLISHNSSINLLPEANKAIDEADIVIYSPGTQHSSLYPTYMTNNVANVIAQNTNALKIFITNIGADYESPIYIASEYLKNAYKYLNRPNNIKNTYRNLFHYNFVNDVNKNNFDKEQVLYDANGFNGIDLNIILDDFEDKKKLGQHDGKKVIDKIQELYKKH